MKKYSELTEDERKKAFESGFRYIMKDISEMPDYYVEIEDEISKASDIAERNYTPWFFCEILYHEIEGAKEKIDKLVQEYIENALYPKSGEYVLYI